MPVQVTRTRLQDSQKLWVSGVMKPIRCAGLLHPHIARRTAGALRRLFERPALAEARAQQRDRQVLVEPALAADIAHRHHLDEGEVVAFAAAPFDQRLRFVVVDALERDGVDLDPDAGFLRRTQASSTVSSLPQRVISVNFSGSSVSIETLTRLTPSRASSSA